MQLHFWCQGGAKLANLGRIVVVDHNAKDIRMLVSQIADHATNAGGTKGTTSTYYDSFQIAQGETNILPLFFPGQWTQLRRGIQSVIA